MKTNVKEKQTRWYAGITEKHYNIALSNAVAEERNRLIDAAEKAKDTGDASGIERDIAIWNRAIDYCIGKMARA
jgi:hypothetical protein